ncbi:DNA polymerase alpha subunit B [Saguinus oedipus]|uniref:DNA polymerase alpha subunit B n=1 Tax=Saguinus oedipus TaxID=9490 RepID=A0ABQ9USX2_SAGOE|nr:DNA polymerase alpha subunit B [Saguinus oedipus]
MSVSPKQLAEELQIFGLDCEEVLIEKCESRTPPVPQRCSTLSPEFLGAQNRKGLNWMVELCVQYGQNEEGMVSELIAFCTSTRKDGLTSEVLNSFEHEFLSKRLSKARHSAYKDTGHAGARDIVSIQELIEVEEEEEILLNSYTTPSKSKKAKNVPYEVANTKPGLGNSRHQLTTWQYNFLNSQTGGALGQGKLQMNQELISSIENNLSIQKSKSLNRSLSVEASSATPSQKYNSRSNRGEVVTSFGSSQGVSWSGRGGAGNINLKVLGCPEALTGSYKSMFQKLPDIREVLTYKIEELGSELKEHYKIEVFTPLLAPAQEPVTLLGQIGCDSNGKLNNKSVILEGDREHSSGAQIPVDLSELKEYSLFPGQVVIMEGINTTGRKLVATKLYEGVPLPFYQPTEEDGDFEQTMVLVACGPYTTSDSITYDPLLDLIAVINHDRPDVCILFGPFLDAKHEQVEVLSHRLPCESTYPH